MKTLHQIITLFCLLIALFLFPACPAAENPVETTGKSLLQEEAPAGDAAVAKVNTTVIQESELNEAINAAIAQTPQLGAMMSSEEQMKNLKMNVLQNLISTELLFQEAKKIEIEDLEKQVEETYSTLRANFPDDEAFQATLAQQKMTESDLRQQIEKGTRIQNLVDQNVKKDISIADDEVRSFYDENADKFEEKESVKASHILIQAAKDAEKQDDEKAHNKIKAIHKRAKAGEDFAQLAKENSEDPSAAQNSGDLGYFAHGQMVPEFDKAAFALKVGEISDIVKTDFGYHIIKCEDKKPARKVPFEEVSEKISQYLESMASQTKLNEYIETLKQASKVEVLMN